MSAAVLIALAGGLMLLAGGARADSTSKPPKLPEPLGSPPNPKGKVEMGEPYVVKKAVPGSPPKGAAKPGTPPKPAQMLTPAQLTAQQKKAAAAKKPKAPVTKPLGKAVAKQAAAKPPAQTKPAAGKQPTGGVKASPVLEPNHGALPAGYDPVKAKSRARAVAAHLAKKGPAGYSHAELKSWQQQAGLTPDGLYGGSSRGALIFFGVKDPPRPFFAPVATLPYVPPEQR